MYAYKFLNSYSHIGTSSVSGPAGAVGSLSQLDSDVTKIYIKAINAQAKINFIMRALFDMGPPFIYNLHTIVFNLFTRKASIQIQVISGGSKDRRIYHFKTAI